MRVSSLFLICGVLGLVACDPYPLTPTPDYSIRVMPSGNGMVAIPPRCPSWVTETTDPYDNQQLPQLGCANARNLALTVENPEDIVKGRDYGAADPTATNNAVTNYRGGYTRGLIDPGADASQIAVTTAPSATSASSSSSSSSSPASNTAGGASNPVSPVP